MKITLKNVLLVFVVAFVIISIWFNPSGMATSWSNFISATASWFGDLFDKITTFLSGLANS
jgi:hypothetical protein